MRIIIAGYDCKLNRPLSEAAIVNFLPKNLKARHISSKDSNLREIQLQSKSPPVLITTLVEHERRLRGDAAVAQVHQRLLTCALQFNACVGFRIMKFTCSGGSACTNQPAWTLLLPLNFSHVTEPLRSPTTHWGVCRFV